MHVKAWTPLILLLTTMAVAQQPHIPETSVYDQYAQQLSFYTDLVKGRTVAINFIFTSCATICPVLAANFRKVEQELEKDGHGGQVQLISISVDPVTDTPERLKQFAAKFHGGLHW